MSSFRKKSFGPRKSKGGPKSKFGLMLDGLMAQGIEYEDAVETLKVGLRQAAGRSTGAPSAESGAQGQPGPQP